MMKLKELAGFLDNAVPVSFQESYDNCGLQVGDPEADIASALLTLDVTLETLVEAEHKGCNLIISHHPLIFNGVKKITGSTPTEIIIRKALKDDIAIYSAHTNLDSIRNGVSWKMAEKLGLKDVKVLSPLKGKIMKLVTFVPDDHIDKIRDAVFGAGAGVTGRYDKCSFSLSGTGSFRAGEGTNPYTGKPGVLHFENEIRFETVFYSHLKRKILNALLAAHPYEEVAYDLYQLENESTDSGLGCTGYFEKALNEKDFLETIAGVFDARGIRHTMVTGREITKVALCGGSGSSFLNEAVASGADAFVTADVRYHTFQDAAGRILLADIGHYESEKFAVESLYDLIIKKFPTFALRFSEINTNPINYI